MILLPVIFWTAAALLAWTHVGYALFVSALARVRPRPVRRGELTPTVTLIITAHDERAGIEATVRTMLALDYPADRYTVLVASDGSTDGTDELVEALAAAAGQGRLSLLRCPRGGKVAAQDRAVRASAGTDTGTDTDTDTDTDTGASVAAGPSEIVAFSDANGEWEPDALARLVTNFADPDVAYACGTLRLRRADGTNREGLYWRYELWLRGNEARIGSITAGNGGIYAVRRSDYIESDGRAGHDLGLPYQLVQRGRRATSDPEAVAWESPARDLEDEYRRKVRMSARCWQHVVSGRMLRGGGPLYRLEMISHRLLRYESGLLHLLLFLLAVILSLTGPDRTLYGAMLGLQLGALLLALAGRLRLPVPGAAIAYYYLLTTWATVAGLMRYLRVGVPVTWEQAEGTRASA